MLYKYIKNNKSKKFAENQGWKKMNKSDKNVLDSIRKYVLSLFIYKSLNLKNAVMNKDAVNDMIEHIHEEVALTDKYYNPLHNTHTHSISKLQVGTNKNLTKKMTKRRNTSRHTVNARRAQMLSNKRKPFNMSSMLAAINHSNNSNVNNNV